MVHGSHPSLALDLVWGYMEGTTPTGWAHELLYGHLGAHGPWDPHTSIPDGKPMDYRVSDNLKQMHGGRYFVIVSAFDFQDWLHHKATLLWQAHISTEIWGHYFDQVLPAMVTTAAPLLGRETTRPQLVAMPAVPDGHVIIGQPYVRSVPDAPASAGDPSSSR